MNAAAKIATRDAGQLRSVPAKDRDEAWISQAWVTADRLRANGGSVKLAQALEDACERLEIVADGKQVPRKRRSDAPTRGPSACVARTIARGLADGYDLDRACLYAGLTVEQHEARLRSGGAYRAAFEAQQAS